MPVNPSKQTPYLNNPTDRANALNDPQFENQQGYFPYDLTHPEVATTRFGEVPVVMHLDTVPADRIVCHHDVKTLHNQIQGNFLNTVNQYLDSYYVPQRALMPINYEKFLPNPTKGDDLPNSALPMVPLGMFFKSYLFDHRYVITSDVGDFSYSLSELVDRFNNEDDWDEGMSFYYGRVLSLAYVLSRGQLLDFLGVQFDTDSLSSYKVSALQDAIDQIFSVTWELISAYMEQEKLDSFVLRAVNTSFTVNGESYALTNNEIVDRQLYTVDITGLSDFRAYLSDVLERGDIPWLDFHLQDFSMLFKPVQRFLSLIDQIFDISVDEEAARDHVERIDRQATPWSGYHFNISKCLAYQQIIAQYFTRDSVDNIFSSDLFMQNLRSVMYPSVDGFTQEPVFDFNGVATEYDLISYGGFYYALLDAARPGIVGRQHVFMTLMFLLRRSLRYGDYFSTARPNMLAVGDLQINVEQGVSPIDITKNLLLQRYLNAANYIGSSFLQYMTSMFGVKPSDTGCIPRYLAHRKIVLQSQITNNTADEQGKQTTNLVGLAQDKGFDVFIDDVGVILTLNSFDVLPIYCSGIDASTRMADRFDYFNPMLQGIGDQPILSDELVGYPAYNSDIFGYTMRNAQYKYKLGKAHGAFCNSLPGFLMKYPVSNLSTERLHYNLNINPDFIRDKPQYFDNVVSQMTGVSPSEYYHFVQMFVNEVKAARKIQATPPVLF